MTIRIVSKMLNKFSTAINLFKGIRKFNVTKNKVLVIDETGINMLEKTILYDLEYSVLPVSLNAIYISPPILFGMAKNVKYLFDGPNRPISLGGKLYFVYLLSCLHWINPKLVITFIDNSIIFQYLSVTYEKAVFYAIENGIRSKYDVDIKYKYVMPNYFCFGYWEKELFEKYGHSIKNYYPVGSLLGGYYKYHISGEDIPIKYDICLVSQWRESIMNGNIFPEIKVGIATLFSFLGEYIKENNVKFCVASPSDEEEQFNYYEKVFKDKATVIQYNRENFSTYAAMDCSDVIVAFDSTAAREAFGWGKKVLFCNFSGDDNYDFPIQGIWSINHADYDEFRERMNLLCSMNVDEYLKQSGENLRYMMNYDFQLPAHILINKKIKEIINNL